MTSRADPVSKAVYRSVLQYARQFDKNIAAKALIQRYGAVRPPSDDFDVSRGDRRLYAAALEVVVGSQCHVRPERLTWSLQRLVRNMRRADKNNLEVVAERAVENQNAGSDGLPLVDSQSWEEDAMAAISLETFFPGALRGVEGDDKINAGFAALRELSSKWALAKSLGLAETDGDEDDDHDATVARKRRRRRVARPRHKMTKRAMRVLRHQERQASQAGGKGDRRTSPGASSGTIPRKSGRSGLLSGVLVTPTEIPAKGVFLISHPLAGLHSPGDIFHRSVVFLVHHDAEGSYGLVVNKDRGETLEEALSSDAVPLAPDALKRVLDNPVRTGGPVMSRLAWLHHYEEVGGVRLSEDTEHPVFFCGAMEKASELLGEGVAEPMDFSLLVGASSWLGGQLRGELDHGMWIMAKAPASVAFAGGKDLWRDMLEAMGGPYAEMGRVPHGHHWAQIGVQNSPSDWT